MNSYNTQRTHSGKYCFGKTPMQTFLEGIEVARRYQLQDAGKIQRKHPVNTVLIDTVSKSVSEIG